MKTFKLVFALMAPVMWLGAQTPTNVHMPYDMDFFERVWTPNLTTQVGIRGEAMVATRAFNADEKVVPVTQIYTERESALAMLEGAAVGTALHGYANRFRGMQDGTRGMFSVTGELAWKQLCVDALYRLSMIKLPGLFSVGIHLPFIEASLSDIKWTSLTQSQTLQDDIVRGQLVQDENSLASFVLQNGDARIGSQQRVGMGDVACMLYWQGNFAQYQRRLQEVFVQLRFGLTLPTAHKMNNDNIFDIDFGRDGSATVPAGGGLRLTLGEGVRVGIDVGATFIVRRLREWRLKTSWAQTPYLMLSKGLATKEYGPDWRFTLYGQAEARMLGLVFTGAYQFFKRTDSTFYPQDDMMNAKLINSSPLVDISESHNVVGALTFVPVGATRWRFLPEMTVQVTVPFNGKSVMSGTLVSAGFSVKF